MSPGSAGDYVVSGTVITTAVAPGANDAMYAYYRK